MQSIKLTSKDKFKLLFNNIKSIILNLLVVVVCIYTLATLDIKWRVALMSLGNTYLTEGAIQKIEKTHFTVNESPVMRYYYAYKDGDEDYQGISYSTDWEYDEGEKVTVEFTGLDPSISRIESMDQRALGDGFVGVSLIFVGLSIVWVIFEKRRIRKLTDLLSCFEYTQAQFIQKIETNAKVGEQEVYRMIYAYEVNQQKFKQSMLTTQPDKRNKVESLVYSLNDSRNSIFLKDLPREVRKQVDTSKE